MFQQRWRFIKIPKGSSFQAKVTPTGAVGSGGDWFRPDGSTKSWTDVQLKAGVSEPLNSSGRSKADIIVRPHGGSATMRAWVEDSSGNLIAERIHDTGADDWNYVIFVYVV